MNTAYGRAVFDEWAIVSVADQKTSLLQYTGPRRKKFRR
jgi:hypothetical protein